MGLGNNARLRGIHDELRSITRDCQEDMHEPGNQGVSATTTGVFLDNAGGDDNELVVLIRRDVNAAGSSLMINLADLIALARMARI